MIAHVSMPADDCEHVARVLAEMLEGGASRFPPGGTAAYNCWSRNNDFQIVVTPRGNVMLAGPKEQIWVSRSRRDDDRACESHFAMASPRGAEEIVALAQSAGWHARVCDRGGCSISSRYGSRTPTWSRSSTRRSWPATAVR
jgi:hypothetical protein